MNSLGQTLKEISTLLNKHGQYDFLDRADSLAQEFSYLIKFWKNGYEDNQRELLYDKMLRKAEMLKRDIILSAEIQKNPYLASLKRELGPMDIHSDSMVEVLKRSDLPLNERYTLLNKVFTAIVLSSSWNEQNARSWISYLIAEDTDEISACVIISAIMLSARLSFCIEKFRTLIMVYISSTNTMIAQRALVGWIFSMNPSDEMFEEEQQQLIEQTFESKEGVGQEIVELFIQVDICNNADADSNRVLKEIIPQVSKGHSQKPGVNIMLVDDEDQSDESVERLEKSMNQILNMQNRGMDLYFQGFCNMKKYPFFYKFSNWFMPFTSNHPDIAECISKVGEMKFLERMFTDGPFCDSDKYSFVFAFTHVLDSLPEKMRKMMENGEVAPIGTLDPDDSRKETAMYIRRMYMQNLYRFYKLFPQYKFKSVFEERSINVVSLLKQYDSNNDSSLIYYLNYLLKKSKYKNPATTPQVTIEEAHEIYKSIINKGIGTENDSQRNSSYQSALKGYAKTAFAMGLYREASFAYDNLLTESPDVLSYKLNYLMSMAYSDCNSEIINEIYRVDFENENNVSVKRVLGWILLLGKKTEQAAKILSDIAEGQYGKPTKEDFLNAAYPYWFMGDMNTAIKYIKNYARQLNEHTQFVAALANAMKQDERIMELYSITPSSINMIIDAALF